MSLSGRTLNLRQRAEMHEILDRALGRGTLPLKVASEDGQLQKHRRMHYHFRPEIFMQLQGTTDFFMPKEDIYLRANEFLIMPAGVPHREEVKPGVDEPFRNLVVGFYSNCLSLHFAHEARPGKPDIEAIEFFDAPDIETYVTLVNQLVTTYHSPSAARQPILEGLFQALLGLLKNLVDVGGGNLNKDIGKVFQTKWLVREQLADPALNVKAIAEKLQCSADYLSHLFNSVTGEKLIHYIQRMRIEGSMLALRSTQLYISEIAWSSGFQDPAYFARIFKKFTGETPAAYRARMEQMHTEKEQAPKTVYHDREDFTHGEPVR